MEKNFNKRISALLCIVVFVAIIPMTAFADGVSNLLDNLSEDSSAFSVLEIREGSLDGDTVVDLLNPSGTWNLETNKDYYIYGEAIHLTDNDYVRIRFGNEDGTFNGVTFFNPPGGVYTPGGINHDYFDMLTSYHDFENPHYGNGTARLSLKDGEMIYHIKSDVAFNSTVKFAMGMIINDAAFNGDSRLESAIQVAIGDVEGDTFSSASQKTCSLNMASKGNLKAYYNSSSVTASLNKPSGIITYYISEENKNNLTAILYEKAEFDLIIPTGSIISGIGFTTAFQQSHSSYGTLTKGETTVNGDTTTVHFSINNGFRDKNSQLYIYYGLTFPSEYFTAGQVCKAYLTNFQFTLSDETVIAPVPSANYAQFTILDDSKDQTTMSATNRTDLYNQTVTGSTDYLLNLGSSYIVNKNVSNPTPVEKTYEVNFNSTNTAANISMVTVPVGTKLNQQAFITGENYDGETVTVTAEQTATSSTRYLKYFANDYGLKNITHIKVDIGKLIANFKSSGWTSGMSPDYNFSGAFGYFTTGERGIQVKNTYRLYNTDPSLRDLEAGDLIVTSTATSSTEGRIGYTVNNCTIYNTNNKVVDSVAAGDSVIINGSVIPYVVPYAAKKSSTGKLANSCLVVDPVVYLTLPQGITYESLSFSLTDNPSLDYNIENISYMNTTGDGTSLYKISFPKGTIIGYSNKEGKAISLSYKVKYNTSKSLLTKRYEINSLMGVSAEIPVEGMPYSNNPVTLASVIPDTYGINDGLDYAGVARGSATEQPGFGLQQLAEINVYNAVSVTKINGEDVEEKWYAYNETDPNSIASIGRNSAGRFRLLIENTSDSAASNLQIVVPIPKAGLDLGGAFMTQPSEFDMKMSFDESSFTDRGFSASYVTASPSEQAETAFVTNAANEASANAILLTCEEVPARENYEFYFDFVVENGQANKQNIWRDAFQYTTSDGTTQYKTGSNVASEVACGKIEGTVFADLNRDAVQDTEEEGVQGVSVIVTDDFNKVYSTTTDENGEYVFLAVRESAVDTTFSVPSTKDLRFNVENETTIPADNGLSATASFTALANNTVNAPMSGFCVLTYDKNNASGVIPPVGEYVEGEDATVAVKPDSLLLKGYVFKEWNTSPDGKGESYQPGQTFEINEDMTLYAIWKLGSYTISLNYRGATGGNDVASITRSHNELYGTLPVPTKTGYTFAGWCNTATGKSANLNSGSRFTTGEDATIYAIWTPKDNLGVDITGEGDPDYYIAWNEKVIPAEEPTKNGYLIEGWEYQGEAFVETATFGELAPSEETDVITIAPVWISKSGYTVEYDVDGDTSAIEPRTDVMWDENNIIPNTNPSKANYAFAGWKFGDIDVSESTTYADLAENDETQSILLTATWTELSDNTVHYDSQGGTVFNDKTGVKNDDTNIIPSSDPVKPGFSFVGWTERLSNTPATKDTIYSDLSSDSSITLVASWAAKSYTISYDSGDYGSLSKGWSDDSLIPLSQPERVGSVFTGWYYGAKLVTPETTVAQLIPGDNTNSITLKAGWTEKTYTVVYESNGGTYFSPKTNVKYSDTSFLPDSAPLRTGYTFDGWYAGDTRILDSTVCSQLVTADDQTTVELNAHWIAKTGFTVNFNSAGGSEIQSRNEVTWTDTGLLPSMNPTRTGYSFAGWICGRNVVSINTPYSSLASSDMAGSSITLVAQWNNLSYQVIFNTDGGSSLNNKAVTWNSQNLLSSSRPEKEGYRFVGWEFNGNAVTSATRYSELALRDDVTEITLDAVYEMVGVETEGGLGTDVQGKVIEDGLIPIYKVDLAWGPMKFVYETSTAWNADTHEYENDENGSWVGDSMDGINNRITAANHSNGDVTVNFSVSKEGSPIGEPTENMNINKAFDSVDMSVNQSNMNNGSLASGMPLAKVPTEGAEAPEIEAFLRLSGKPSNIGLFSSNTFEKVGVITVTVLPAGGDLTPYK